MTNQKFKTGDVVQLKSGGPWMTVVGVEDGEVSCTWFDKDNLLKSNEFDEETLNKRDTGTSSVQGGSGSKRNNYW